MYSSHFPVLSSAKTIAERKKTDLKEKIKQKAEDYWNGEQPVGKLYVQGMQHEIMLPKYLVNAARFNEQGTFIGEATNNIFQWILLTGLISVAFLRNK